MKRILPILILFCALTVRAQFLTAHQIAMRSSHSIASAPSDITDNLWAWYQFQEGNPVPSAHEMTLWDSTKNYRNVTVPLSVLSGISRSTSLNPLLPDIALDGTAYAFTTEKLPRSTISVTAWVKESATNFVQHVVCAGKSGAGVQGIDLGLFEGFPYFGFFQVSSGNNYSAGPSVFWPPVNTWAFLAGTYDGTTYSLYTNGVLAGSIAGPVADDPGVNTGLGLSDGSSDDLFHGQLADVRVYTRALSPSEIETVYNSGTPFYHTNDVDFINTFATGTNGTALTFGVVSNSTYGPVQWKTELNDTSISWDTSTFFTNVFHAAVAFPHPFHLAGLYTIADSGTNWVQWVGGFTNSPVDFTALLPGYSDNPAFTNVEYGFFAEYDLTNASGSLINLDQVSGNAQFTVPQLHVEDGWPNGSGSFYVISHAGDCSGNSQDSPSSIILQNRKTYWVKCAVINKSTFRVRYYDASTFSLVGEVTSTGTCCALNSIQYQANYLQALPDRFVSGTVKLSSVWAKWNNINTNSPP